MRIDFRGGYGHRPLELLRLGISLIERNLAKPLNGSTMIEAGCNCNHTKPGPKCTIRNKVFAIQPHLDECVLRGIIRLELIKEDPPTHSPDGWPISRCEFLERGIVSFLAIPHQHLIRLHSRRSRVAGFSRRKLASHTVEKSWPAPFVEAKPVASGLTFYV